MTLARIPLSTPMAAVAAALHAVSGLHEPWDERAFAALLDMRGVAGCIIAADDAPAGLILWRTVIDEAEILTLCVAPSSRRRGMGGALLEAAFSAMQEGGVRRLFLEVAMDNRPAIELYLGHGFREEARRAGYYKAKGASIDALVFRKDFDPP
jgi:ribosomal-protein-alanine N-acetyltransferase